VSLYERPWTVLIKFTDGTYERAQNVNDEIVEGGVLHLYYVRQVNGKETITHRGSYPIANIRSWHVENYQ
jgi:hypothetical protein